jgi:fructose-bisphosphate aldolase class II
VLINLKEILTDAKTKGYAVFATNAFNFDSAEIIIKAAEEKKSPVILMVSEGLFKYFNFERLIGPLISMSKEAKIPVSVNLDHGENFKIVMRCIKAGVSSVMYDGSALPVDENITIIKEITKTAHSLGISVEGEVGIVGGFEGNFKHKERDKKKEHFTKTEDAIRFVKETNVDALAISVGTVHGIFKGRPEIDFTRISNIRDAIETPLVLHGCSGLSDDDLKKVIKNGVAKINYFTDLIVEATKRAKEIVKSGNDFNYIELNYNVMIAVKDMIKMKMDILGSSGKG